MVKADLRNRKIIKMEQLKTYQRITSQEALGLDNFFQVFKAEMLCYKKIVSEQKEKSDQINFQHLTRTKIPTSLVNIDTNVQINANEQMPIVQ